MSRHILNPGKNTPGNLESMCRYLLNPGKKYSRKFGKYVQTYSESWKRLQEIKITGGLVGHAPNILVTSVILCD